MGTESQSLTKRDETTLAKHKDLVESVLQTLRDHDRSVRNGVAEPSRESTWEFECDGLNQGINWYLDRAAPRLDPDWHEAAWYYSHCAIRQETIGPVTSDDYTRMQNELTHFVTLSPLFSDLRRLMAIGQRVCTSPDAFAKIPWVSVRPRYKVIELLAWSHDYWCHFHESYAEKANQSFIIISFTPFLEQDCKTCPGIFDGLLSSEHPQFGSVML